MLLLHRVVIVVVSLSALRRSLRLLVRHAGVHGVLLSVLGSLCAVFCAYYAKKCQEELRQAAKPATIVDDIPPSYKASTTAPLLVASDADMTPVEPSNSQII